MTDFRTINYAVYGERYIIIPGPVSGMGFVYTDKMKAYVKVYHWNKNGTIKHDTYKFNSLEEAREYYNKKYIAKGMMKTLCKGNHEEIEKETNF